MIRLLLHKSESKSNIVLTYPKPTIECSVVRRMVDWATVGAAPERKRRFRRLVDD